MLLLLHLRHHLRPPSGSHFYYKIINLQWINRPHTLLSSCEISSSHIHHASLNLSIRVHISNPQYALMQNFLFHLITKLSHYLVPQRHRISVTQFPLYGLEQTWGRGIWGPLQQTTNAGYISVHVTLRKKKKICLRKCPMAGVGVGEAGGRKLENGLKLWETRCLW